MLYLPILPTCLHLPTHIGLTKNFVQLVNMLFSKVLCENEKCVFYFYLKPNELFSQPNTYVFSSVNIMYRLSTPKLISPAQISPQSNCLPGISIRMSNNHLKLNTLSNTKLLIFPKPVLPVVFCTYVSGNTTFFFLMPKTLEFFFTPLSHIPHPINQQIFASFLTELLQ